VDLGIRGRTAAVAAASAGLGYAAADALASEGVRVAICSRDAARARDAASRIGHGCVGIPCDVSTPEGATRFVCEAREALGHLDIAVLNGGGPKPGGFAATRPEDHRAALDATLMAAVAMTHEVVPAMRERGWGRVVAITSVSVRQPIPTLILSTTARAGLTGFLKTVAREVAADGVTVNSVQPGSHATDRMRQLYGDDPAAGVAGIPAGRMGDPADFGRVVAFLCGEPARYVTGVHLQVDGGAYAGLI
jgi:3-oxoacyl-[acyl-carrier protein] reductase